MLTFSRSTRRLPFLLAAAVSLLGVACSGAADDRPAYAGSSDEWLLGTSSASLSCERGEVRSCTIWLGSHGDLNNCVFGVDVCMDAGDWSGCIDDATLSDHPELYSELSGAE